MVLAASIEAQAQSTSIYVTEAAGIRRFNYPVNARVPFPKGTLPDAAQLRLLLNDIEVPAQYLAESRWPDGSVQWLAVDFNASPGPIEQQTYRLEYGADVRAAPIQRGLAVSENADGIQVGAVRFSRTAVPLLVSATYGAERIAAGKNGIEVTDASGTAYDLSRADSVNVEIVKRGPLYVVLRYSGRIAIDSGYSAPFQIAIEMPSSKSWVKVSAMVEDPGKRLRELSLHTPLAFTAPPLFWDFGTDRWTYGVLRTAADSATLTQTVKGGSIADWQIWTGPKGQEQLYETPGANRSRVSGWGHIQDAKGVVAFAILGFGSQPGTYNMALDGAGHATFRVAPAQAGTRHQIIVYQHFVGTPVQVGAATSPAAMVSPLTAVCESEQYTRSGVQPPPDAVSSTNR